MKLRTKNKPFTYQLEGLIFEIIIVFEFPPKESYKRNQICHIQKLANNT